MIGVPSFDNRITEVRHGMGELYVMRRANGDIFAEQVNGNLVIPVWSSKDEVARYKARNPELIIFLPARLDRSLIRRIKSGLSDAGTTRFLLLSDNDPDAYLYDGRPVKLEELFPEEQSGTQSAQAQAPADGGGQAALN